MPRTTITADEEDLRTLRTEAERRGISFAELMREVVAETAARFRARRRPRFGLGRSTGGVVEESVRDEDSPAATDPGP